ncbi:MAG: CpaF family protein [Deltaproteobacteria bacterium]|nr:MAG: CpaF family protein [Deltaproteobacteria bacterium]
MALITIGKKKEQKPAPRQARFEGLSPSNEISPYREQSFFPTQLKRHIYEKLMERLDISENALESKNIQLLRTRAEREIQAVLEEENIPPEKWSTLSRQVLEEVFEMGPLGNLLVDERITEIMVNGHESVYVEVEGRLHKTDLSFISEGTLLAIIQRIVSAVNRRVDESSPYVDARLPDGSRVNVILPPLSLSGPCLTIRKFSRKKLSPEDLLEKGTLTLDALEYLQRVVRSRANIVVGGGTGTGKTTFLNMLSSFIPDGERIITIEDSAELRIAKPHVVSLESRPPNIEGKGEVTIRDLVRNSLRMRPDRIIVGECRGGETLDMLQAMNTGHNGSMTTAHANSPRDLLNRLETMALFAGVDLPIRAIREQIAAAVDVIVFLFRDSDGKRRVSHITELTGIQDLTILHQDIFRYSYERGVLERTGVRSKYER